MCHCWFIYCLPCCLSPSTKYRILFEHLFFLEMVSISPYSCLLLAYQVEYINNVLEVISIYQNFFILRSELVLFDVLFLGIVINTFHII